jgi:hypothetical protein
MGESTNLVGLYSLPEELFESRQIRVVCMLDTIPKELAPHFFFPPVSIPFFRRWRNKQAQLGERHRPLKRMLLL